MIKHFITTIIFICLCGILSSFAQKTSFVISKNIWYLDGHDAIYQDVNPGDTLFFEAGNRDYLLIRDFHGAEGKPIVFINSGGEVIIDTDHYYGISIQNCHYFKFTGTGDSDQMYGFHIKRVANGSGIGIGEKSSDFEIDHVSVENCLIGGIYAKTDPDCDQTSVRGAFTQYNTVIHDNYIANAGNEGLYIGSTKYHGQTVNCDGEDILLLPGLLDGVKVYNNIIKYSGWDGIQVSSATKNCQIYNNTVLFDSQAEYENQMSGIIIGGGSKCDCYNNFIANGKGNGIESHGIGGYKIFNNIILNAGLTFLPLFPAQMKHGIFVSDVSAINDSTYYILHNDIINPKSDGIRFSSIKSKNNLIASNAIVNPGNFDYYENGNTSFKGKDSYVMFQNSASDVVMRDNLLTRNISDAGFHSEDPKVPIDFSLDSKSILIDQADPESSVYFDFVNFPRPFGNRADIGAFEYDATIVGNNLTYGKKADIRLLDNPVNDFLKFNCEIPYHGEMPIEIFDAKGVCQRKKSLIAPSLGSQILQVSVNDLPIGVYFYRIQTEKVNYSGKFVKVASH